MHGSCTGGSAPFGGYEEDSSTRCRGVRPSLSRLSASDFLSFSRLCTLSTSHMMVALCRGYCATLQAAWNSHRTRVSELPTPACCMDAAQACSRAVPVQRRRCTSPCVARQGLPGSNSLPGSSIEQCCPWANAAAVKQAATEATTGPSVVVSCHRLPDGAPLCKLLGLVTDHALLATIRA